MAILGVGPATARDTAALVAGSRGTNLRPGGDTLAPWQT